MHIPKFDVKLIVHDKHSCLVIYAHKNIIKNSFPFFQKLMSQKDQYEFNISVPNAKIAYSIIMEVYGIHINESKLRDIGEYAKCRNFLGLDNDKLFLKEMKLPSNEIELLINFSRNKNLNYNDDLLFELSQKLQPKFDFTKLSTEFISELIRVNDREVFICADDNDVIHMRAIRTGKIIKSYDMLSKRYKFITTDRDNKYLVFAVSGLIVIRDFLTDTIINKIKCERGWLNEVICDSENVIVSYDNGDVDTFSILTGEKIYSVSTSTNDEQNRRSRPLHKNEYITPDETDETDNTYLFFDAMTGKMNGKVLLGDGYYHFKQSYDNKYLLAVERDSIAVIEMATHTVINMFNIKNDTANFTHDNKIIMLW